MKQYEIFLESGHTYIVEGLLIDINGGTGQSIIYSGEFPLVTNVVAVIPSTASVRVVS